MPQDKPCCELIRSRAASAALCCSLEGPPLDADDADGGRLACGGGVDLGALSTCPSPAFLNLRSSFFFLKNSLMADMMVVSKFNLQKDIQIWVMRQKQS